MSIFDSFTPERIFSAVENLRGPEASMRHRVSEVEMVKNALSSLNDAILAQEAASQAVTNEAARTIVRTEVTPQPAPAKSERVGGDAEVTQLSQHEADARRKIAEAYGEKSAA